MGADLHVKQVPLRPRRARTSVHECAQQSEIRRMRCLTLCHVGNLRMVRRKALVEKPNQSTNAARALIEGFGGKLHAYYFSFGKYDGLAICEFPDATAAAACSLVAMATGALLILEFTALSTAAEAEAAMKKAPQYEDRI